MKAAIAQLEIALDVVTTNEPINRASGKTEQADLEAANAASYREAIGLLKAADAAAPRTMRAKMEVESLLIGKQSEKVTMKPVCAKSYPADGSDENNTFAKFSPSGSLELWIANPALAGMLKPGDTYYLDFTRANS